ncbi:autotransporter outer membrane beta-barrel domain-containing protein [Shimwellia pseudoproteus]|uniref:autotransporter outer membrane beta-barrel domain-containing protein n=1 Tax=Shimwellia pseudoproteus TaxID=570012 RepID=UPI001E4DA243|nr:autotransporter serine protease [Shimwellia pseudoproteus]
MGLLPVGFITLIPLSSASSVTPEAQTIEYWRTPEFMSQWGLESIGAEYAYARGYSGKDIAIGILDEALFEHPEFKDKLTIISPDDPLNAAVLDDGSLELGLHGVHVAGIAAARRDGVGMHGVAYDADIIAAKYLQNEVDHAEAMIQSNARIINNSWGYEYTINHDQDEEPIVLPDGTYYYEQATLQTNIDYYAPLIDQINTLTGKPVSGEEGDLNAEIGMLRAARNNKLIVISAGNGNNYNVPIGVPALPYFSPDVFSHFLAVTNLDTQDDLHVSSTSCGFTASYCVSAPGADIFSAAGHLVSTTGGEVNLAALQKGELGIQLGYEHMTGTSMAAPMVSGAAAVLMQRFPYMTTAQIADVLKTTAVDLGAPGLDARFGWGKISLRNAIDGPGMFVTRQDIPGEFYIDGTYSDTQFTANLPGIGAVLDAGTPLERVCGTRECAWDRWDNDISGHGGLTKIGSGTLVLNGNNSYRGPTLVNEGKLVVENVVASDVTVQQRGTLSGGGQLGSLHVGAGGTVAPGNGIGTLTVQRNVQFDPGSLYRVEVTRNGEHDQIHSTGSAILNGGDVAVSLVNDANLLSHGDVLSMAGRTFRILTAANGVTGSFSAVAPDYLFIGAQLNVQPDALQLAVGRNHTAFASVAQTANQRAVARAADQLAPGNPVYESILASYTASDARQAFSQLAGQIHGDIASVLLNNSRYLRDALNGRLRQAQTAAPGTGIKTSGNGVWGQMVGAWQQAQGSAGIMGYSAATHGILLGGDSQSADGTLTAGVAAGVTRTSLHGGNRSTAHSDNYHLALYAGKTAGPVALRSGVANSWHRLDTARNVRYGSQADSASARYNGATFQWFGEAGYSVNSAVVDLEPFARLAYARTQQGKFSERGGAAALQGPGESIHSTLSTLGLRAGKQWQLDNGVGVSLYGEAGWQHQYNDPRRGSTLAFGGGNPSFYTRTVAAPRDSAVVKLTADIALSQRTSLSFSYSGLLSGPQQDNGIQAGIKVQF